MVYPGAGGVTQRCPLRIRILWAPPIGPPRVASNNVPDCVVVAVISISVKVDNRWVTASCFGPLGFGVADTVLVVAMVL